MNKFVSRCIHTLDHLQTRVQEKKYAIRYKCFPNKVPFTPKADSKRDKRSKKNDKNQIKENFHCRSVWVGTRLVNVE